MSPTASARPPLTHRRLHTRFPDPDHGMSYDHVLKLNARYIDHPWLLEELHNGSVEGPFVITRLLWTRFINRLALVWVLYRPLIQHLLRMDAIPPHRQRQRSYSS